MHLINMLRILCYLGLPLGCSMAQTSMAKPAVHMHEQLNQFLLDLAVEPTVRPPASFLSSVPKPLAMPRIAENPRGSAQSGMLKFVAKGKMRQVFIAQAVTAMVNPTTQCVALTYDKNGNRLSQTVTSMTASSVTWGSGVYGCFVWAP